MYQKIRTCEDGVVSPDHGMGLVGGGLVGGGLVDATPCHIVETE